MMTYKEIATYLDKLSKSHQETEVSKWLSFVKRKPLFPTLIFSGKKDGGDVANYVNAIYSSQGYKTGWLNNEREKAYTERIKFGCESISEDDFARIFNQNSDYIISNHFSLPYVLSLISLIYFSEQKIDVCLYESDLENWTYSFGDLKLLVMLDNEDITLLEKNEKLRKMKLFASETQEKKIKELMKAAQKKELEVFLSKDVENAAYVSPYYYFDYQPYKKLEILSPSRQLLVDASLALEIAKILRLELPVSENSIRVGLSNKPLPCRFEKVGNVIIDKASEFEDVCLVFEIIKKLYKDKDVYVLFASEKNNAISKIISFLKKNSANLLATTFDSKEARKEDDYSLYKNVLSFNDDWKVALHFLLKEHSKDIILVIGSLEFAYIIRDYLKSL